MFFTTGIKFPDPDFTAELRYYRCTGSGSIVIGNIVFFGYSIKPGFEFCNIHYTPCIVFYVFLFKITFLRFLIHFICLGLGSVTVSSRIFFAMARDGALPGSHWIYEVVDETRVPLRAVLVVLICDALLLLLPLVSTTAFAAIMSSMDYSG